MSEGVNLFSPYTVRGVTLPNRVTVSPMSQYAAVDGVANDWHFAHLTRFALGGAGLVFTEATGVEERGRRTHGDLGLWHDGQIEPLARINTFLKQHGAVPGIQLAHAGRKASERRPWHGETPVDNEDVAVRVAKRRGRPSVRARCPMPRGGTLPQAMTKADIGGVLAGFRDAATRSFEAGFEVIEVYAAHGFLVHQFYSPIANDRGDRYGGDFDGRVRFALEVAEAIRSVWPDRLALSFRLSATDWVDGGWEVEDTVELARRLKDRGVDLIDCSTGGIGGRERPRRMTLAEGFQVEFAERVKREAEIDTVAVGMIWSPEFANQVVANGQADLVAVARELLDDPNWPLHAAGALGLDEGHTMWKPEFGWWLNKRERLVRKLGLRE